MSIEGGFAPEVSGGRSHRRSHRMHWFRGGSAAPEGGAAPAELSGGRRHRFRGGSVAPEGGAAPADVSGGRRYMYGGSAEPQGVIADVEGGKMRKLCGKGKRMSRAKKGSIYYRKCVESRKSPTSHHMRRHYSMRRRRSPRSYVRRA